jgi:integrase
MLYWPLDPKFREIRSAQPAYELCTRAIPTRQRIPKKIKKSTSQPALSIDDFGKILNQMATPRDRIITKLLFFCALRRSELLVLKWKDFQEKDGIVFLKIERSFCSRTHVINEWGGKQGSNEGKAAQVVAVPPQLAKDLKGWSEYGLTNSSNRVLHFSSTDRQAAHSDELVRRRVEASRVESRNS